MPHGHFSETDQPARKLHLIIMTDTKPSAILMNDFKRQWQDLGPTILAATERVGASGWYVLGTSVSEFETHLAEYWGATNIIGCANGLDAIEIGLRCLGIKAGDKVLTTPLSAFATTLAIMRCGATPIFVDVDDSGLLDLQQAEQLLQKDGSIRFMVPVHLYGHALSLPDLVRLRDRFELKIVEDCAQAIGAKSHGKPVGSVGQMAATSFYPTKNLGALGDGGAVVTNDTALAMLARRMRDYGQSEKYLHSEFGLNSRLDELHAAILDAAMLPKLKQWTDKRREVAKCYQERITHPSVKLPTAPAGSDSVWHLFPLMISEKRQHLQQWLAQCGIHSGIHYPILISDQPALLTQGPVAIHGDLHQARRFVEHELSIPIHPYLFDEEIERVITAINSWKP